MVVEPDPIQNYLPCLRPCPKLLTVNARRFQVLPQALGSGVDAPMSNGARGVRQVSEYQRVQLTNHVALEAAMDLSFFDRPCPACLGDVFAGACITSHSNHGDGPEGVVCLSLSAAIESMAVSAPAATSISSINSPTNGYYRPGSTLTFTVNFGSAVTVTGSPRMAINVGARPCMPAMPRAAAPAP